ncbi:unnamed protein product [Gadus morhua 'NCC']
MLSGAAKRKKKKNEEEQKKKQQGALQKFLSGSRPTAVNLLVSAEPEAEPGPQPEAEPGPQPGPQPGPETRPEDAAEDAVAPSTSAPSQNDKMMEEQQPARKRESICKYRDDAVKMCFYCNGGLWCWKAEDYP